MSIVIPLSRTDKTLPTNSANRPNSACNFVQFLADKGAKFGSALSPRRAFRVRKAVGAALVAYARRYPRANLLQRDLLHRPVSGIIVS
jgi:hypothetical protein